MTASDEQSIRIETKRLVWRSAGIDCVQEN